MQANPNTATAPIQTKYEQKMARLRERVRAEAEGKIRTRAVGEPKHPNPYGSGRQCVALTREEAAYIAGFLDGEGCIGAYRRADFQKVLHLLVIINNTNQDVLDWICAVTGLGKVVVHKSKSPTKWKDFYTWRIDSAGAASLLEQLLPFLRIKHRQALALIKVHRRGVEDLAGARDRNWQNGMLMYFRVLNRKGPKTASATLR